MNDATLKYILILVIVAAVAFFGGRFSKKCPTTDPALIEALTSHLHESERRVKELDQVDRENMALADTIAKLRNNGPKKPSTVALGRTDAELDSLGAIIRAPW